MQALGTIAVGVAGLLEVGDVFSMSFLGGVVSGTVTGVPFSPLDLTVEQIKYMKDHDISIPEGRFDPIASVGECLIFGDFVGNYKTVVTETFNHMFVSANAPVAVFANRK